MKVESLNYYHYTIVFLFISYQWSVFKMIIKMFDLEGIIRRYKARVLKITTEIQRGEFILGKKKGP